jgi:hypothetical protein
VPNTLTTEQREHYDREGYCFPFDAFPSETAWAYHQKLLDFEQEIGRDPLKVLRIKSHLVVPWLVEMRVRPRSLMSLKISSGPTSCCISARSGPSRQMTRIMSHGIRIRPISALIRMMRLRCGRRSPPARLRAVVFGFYPVAIPGPI